MLPHGLWLMCGHVVWVTGMRLSDGEYVIVVSDSHSEEVMEQYKKDGK